MTTTERPGANDPGLPPASDTPWFNTEGMTPDEFAEGFIRHAAARATAKERQPGEGGRVMSLAMQSPFAVDSAVSDAGIVANLLSVATDLVNELDYALPDGGRNVQLDRLHGLLFAAEKLAKELVETVDALPRVKDAA